MKALLGFFACLALSLGARPAQAGDADDIYLYGALGTQWRPQLFQSSLGAGYVFADGLGTGLVYDQVEDGNHNLAGEFRWFLEPVELAVGAGYATKYDLYKNTLYKALLSAEATYLVAITSSIAARLNFKGQFLWADRGSVFLGLGLRVLL